MKKRCSKIDHRLVVVCAMLPAAAGAYEPGTHALMTMHAANSTMSVMAPGSALYQRLGLENTIWGVDQPYVGAADDYYSTTDRPFNNGYYDQGTSALMWRQGNEFEDHLITDYQQPYGVTGWLMRGAIREDDNPHETGNLTDHDNPVFHREFNHFFDPIFNQPLLDNAPGIGLYYYGNGANTTTLLTAPSWAAGVDDIFKDANTHGSVDMNHFGIPAARESMWRALTGKTKTGGAITPDGSAATELDRKAYWATMLRSLGDIAHLNEDMAQPQHTRNEAHSGVGGYVAETVTGHASEYEYFIDAIVHGNYGYEVSDKHFTVRPPIDVTFDGYPVPAFNDYASYWSTAAGYGQANYGAGLADYSNNNFFTAAHNFGTPPYLSPVSNVSGYTSQAISTSSQYLGTYTESYLTAPALDPLAGESPPIKKTRQGLWTAFISNIYISTYTLDQAIYYENAQQLVPHAVGYATGLFNYFFRGTLEITPPKIGVYGIVDDSVENQKDTTGFRKVKLRLKNTTPSNTGWGNQDMTGGSLTAVIKFHRNTCYTPDLANEWDDTGKTGRLSGTCRSTDEEIVTSNRDDQGNPITGVKLTAGGAPQDLAFDFSATPIPVNATDVYLQVVYRGAQGTEADAVVVATADISEPTHLMLRNVTNSFICINQSWYKLNHDSSVPKAVKPILKAAGGGTVSPSAYTVVTTSFQQSDEPPFVTSAPNFTLPLTYPLVELALGQQLQPAQYMRVSMLTPPQTYFAHYFEGTGGAYQYFNTQSFEGAESEITFTQDKVNSSTTVTTPLLGVNSYLSTFGYQNFGTGDCEHTNDAPTDYLGADGVAFTSPSTLVAAKIDF